MLNGIIERKEDQIMSQLDTYRNAMIGKRKGLAKQNQDLA